MKKILLLTISFCWLFIEPISSQTNWADYRDVALTLVKYGLYSNGKEVNVFTPSSTNHNKSEYIQLKSDGTFVWGNSGNGTEYLKYSINGEFCYVNRPSTGQSWLRLVKKTGDMLFTVDNLGTYRYFKTRPANTTAQQSNRSQAQEQDSYSPDYSYMLTRYSVYDKIKEDFGSILRSAKEEYEMQTVYRFYYDSGWEKILSVSKRTCFSCGGDGKLHNWYAPFPPPSNICSNCKGTGRELPTVRARKENSPYMYMEDGERMYSNYNAGNYNNGSSGNSNNSKSSSSSSSNSLKRTTCSYCGGGGGCRSCNGRGYKYNSYSHHDDACPTCNGSGRCFNCRGSGRL